MHKDKLLNIIAVITARGGSVRLPLKNVKPLNGKPLIAYIIKAARKSKYLRRVIVSTDHSRIKKVSLKYGAEVPFVRPAGISGNCASLLVVQHAVKFVEQQERYPVDIVVTLQPTSPFCRSQDIDACIEMLLKNKAVQSVFSAACVHHRPEWMFELKRNNHVKLCMPGILKGKRILRQTYGKLISPNGAVYVTRREALFNNNVIISNKTLAYMMPRERSIDIDYESDLKLAEAIIKNKR